MARIPTSSWYVELAVLALLALALPARADRAPVDLVGARSQSDLARELAEMRQRVAPPYVEPPRPPVVKPKSVTDYATWGDYTLALNLRSASENDPRELETTFTLPPVLQLYSLNMFHNLAKNAFSFVELRNTGGADSRARAFFRDPGVYKVEFQLDESQFFEIPPQERNSRVRQRGEIEMAHIPQIPVRLAFDLNQVKGPGALGYRDWQSRDLRFEVAADALVADALLTIPLRNFHDDTNGKNDTDSQGVQLKIGSGTLGRGASLGLSQFHLHSAATDDIEDVGIAELFYVSYAPYHIRGLETRSRLKLELRRDQIPRLARTKSNFEMYSVITYRRNRKLTFEMGGTTREIHRIKLDRRGIDLLALKPGATTSELKDFTWEDKPVEADGWTSVSYRGIRRMNVNVRMDAASIRRNPFTDFGNAVSPGLYPDTRAGMTVDLGYNPYSPNWGAGLKLKNETRKLLDRGLTVDDTLATLTGHYTPNGVLTLNGEFGLTTQDSKTAEIKTGQTDSQSYVAGLVYEATAHTQAFADFTQVISSGALAARDYLYTLGIDATEGVLGGATWRLMISRERLRSDVAGITPFTENQLIAQRKTRF